MSSDSEMASDPEPVIIADAEEDPDFDQVDNVFIPEL